MTNSLPELQPAWDSSTGYRMFSRRCVQGGRPKVILVHGLAMSSSYLVPTGQRLAQTYDIYAPDLPGYGRSPHPPRMLPIRDLAQVLGDWLDGQGIREPAFFLGNSMGCQIIVELMLQSPERVKKAVLVGPSVDPRNRDVLRVFMSGVSNMLHEPLSFWRILLRDYLAAGIRETFFALDDAFHYPLEEKVWRVQTPVLVVRGAQDRIVSQAWVEEIVRLLPKGRLLVIPGGAHVANYDKPNRLANAAQEYFDLEL